MLRISSLCWKINQIGGYECTAECAELIENSEEGNRKIVDGVIKVGSVAFCRLSLMPPYVTGRKKIRRGVASPKTRTTMHYLYVVRMALRRHASYF